MFSSTQIKQITNLSITARALQSRQGCAQACPSEKVSGANAAASGWGGWHVLKVYACPPTTLQTRGSKGQECSTVYWCECMCVWDIIPFVWVPESNIVQKHEPTHVMILLSVIFISKGDLAGCNVVLCFKATFNMWNTLENVTCVQQKLKRERRKGDGEENVHKEKAKMTSELAAHPSASQSLQQHEYQSGAADQQDQMKKGEEEREEEREQGLWGNDEAVKGNNCRCIFFFKAQGSPTQANVSSDASEQSLWDTWAEPGSCIIHWLTLSFSQAGIVLGQQEETWPQFRVEAAGSLLCSILLWLLCALACVCLHKCGYECEGKMLLEKYN